MRRRLIRRLPWESLRPGVVEGASNNPVAIYTVYDIPRQRKPPYYHVSVLTEAGHNAFGRTFNTLQTAQRFCETDLWRWRRSAVGDFA